MNIKTPLAPVMQKLKELEQALTHLDNSIAHLRFDPHDPQSIEQAIQDFDATIDRQMANYSKNKIVSKMAEHIKEHGRKIILDSAAASRLKKTTKT